MNYDALKMASQASQRRCCEALKMASQASQRRCCEACEGPESKELQIVRGDLRRLRSDFSKIGHRNSLFFGPSQGCRLRTPIGASGPLP
jgi:hypothetical protein